MGSEVIKLAMKETEKAGFREGYLSAIYSYLELAKGFEKGSKEAQAIMDFSTDMMMEIAHNPDNFMEKYSVKRRSSLKLSIEQDNLVLLLPWFIFC